MKRSDYIKNPLMLFNGEVVDNIVAAVASEFSLPVSGIGYAFVKSLAKGVMQTVMIECFNDISNRRLSTIEERKLELIFNTAQDTFWEFAYANEWEDNASGIDDPSLRQYAFETAEHMVLEGMKQYNQEKMRILGRFYGRTFYMGNDNWNDLHQKISLVGGLTYRQVVIIYFLVNNLLEHSDEESITNPTACIETNQLIDYGICKTTDLIMAGTNKSSPIKLSFIKETDYAKQLYDDFVLSKLDINDISTIVETLGLKII